MIIFAKISQNLKKKCEGFLAVVRSSLMPKVTCVSETVGGLFSLLSKIFCRWRIFKTVKLSRFRSAGGFCVLTSGTIIYFHPLGGTFEGVLYTKSQRAYRTSGSRKQTGHQAAKVIQDIRGQRTTGTSNSRGQAGHQATDDRRDIKQRRTSGTPSGVGIANSAYNRASIWQVTFGDLKNLLFLKLSIVQFTPKGLFISKIFCSNTHFETFYVRTV